MKKYQIYGIGAALVDTEFFVDDEFLEINNIHKGLMTLVDEARQFDLIRALDLQSKKIKRSSGGSACNSVVAASCFGSKVFYSGKVAADDDGDFFVKDLGVAGVDFHNAEASSGVTGKCLVMITDDAERTMNTFLGASIDLSERELDEPALLNSNWLYLEGYLVTDDTRTDLAIKAMSCAKVNDVKTSISLSDPFVVKAFEKNLEKVIGDGVDLLFCNLDEALSFTKSFDTDGAIRRLKKYAKTFVITLGADGSICFDGKELFHTDGENIDAIDTNGAGDLYAGAFLYAINVGQNYTWAAKFANAAAARVVSQFGPRLRTVEYQQLKDQFNI
jgi:sugar/nucleoside kinase (ribokinase family)